MKRILFVVTIIVIMFSTFTVNAANEITVMVNGTKVESETPAVIVEGSTMLPFRAIFNALGVSDDSIKWNQNSQCIEVRSGDKYIFLLIGSTGAIVNDNFITLNAAPYVENGRTFVPVRFVSETLDADVKWDELTKTVIITKN